MRLRNKVAIITGAADGIGKVVAIKMAVEGAKVVIADIQDEKGLETVKEIEALKGTAYYVHCDVGDSEEVEQLMDLTAEKFGRIDILHNNAAVAISGNVTEMEEEAWQKLININLTGVFRGCKYAIPYMLKNGKGSIINTASVQAHVGFKGWTAYAAAKGGIISMTKQLALEFASLNIRVNSISPATIRTPMLTKVIEESTNPDLLQSWKDSHPIGRLGEADEVANAVIFLASDESSFTTGIDMKIDGGLTIKG